MSILEHALKLFNSFMEKTWDLLSQGMDSFLGGKIWTLMCQINEGLQAGSFALLVLFTLMGILKSASAFSDMKRPEVVVKVFMRFIIAKGLITYGAAFMLKVFEILQAVLQEINQYGTGFTHAKLPEIVNEALEAPGLFEVVDKAIMGIVGLLSWIVILIVALTILITVYARFFKLYMYTGLSPILLSTLGGEPTQSIGIGFLKSYAAVCLEGSIITIGCIIYARIAETVPVTTYDLDDSWGAVLTVLEYVVYFVLYALVLVASVKGADRIAKEMMGTG